MNLRNTSLVVFAALLMFTGFSAAAQIIYTKNNRPSAPAIADLPLADSLSQYGLPGGSIKRYG